MTTETELLIVAGCVGHASPRWKGAKNDKDRHAKNLALAQKRADDTAAMLEEHIGQAMAATGLPFTLGDIAAISRESKGDIEPKVRAMQQSVTKRLGGPTAPAAGASGAKK